MCCVMISVCISRSFSFPFSFAIVIPFSLGHLICPTLPLCKHMSFKARPLRRRAKEPKKGQPSMSTASSNAPPVPIPTAPTPILTSRDLKRAHNRRAVPTVTPRGIVGTYTFPAPHGFTGPPGTATSSTPTGASHVACAGESVENDQSHVDGDMSHVDHDSSHCADPVTSSYHLKATRQTDKWITQVIPSLVPIYLHLLRTTQSLTRPPVVTASLCTCGGKVTTLNVLCLYFDCESGFISVSMLLTHDRLQLCGRDRSCTVDANQSLINS